VGLSILNGESSSELELTVCCESLEAFEFYISQLSAELNEE